MAAATIGGAAAATAEATGANEPGGETVTGDGTGEALPPIDDHITAFERRCERLVGIAEEAEFESGTLVGDIRDALLEIFKNRPKPWSQLSAAEQGDINRALESTAKKVLRKLVIVLAEEDDVSVNATLKGYAVDGETFKLKVVAKGDEETAAELFRMDGHEVILIRADARRFHGQRKDGEVQPDQPTLGFSDGAAVAPTEIKSTPPADDSDLAGESSEEEDASDDVNPLDK
ncbi:MAG: hypothetical protein H0U52_00575, partial [Chloroflexi bacterium]|nr:hypothetical protein [Chloroflexota bacterium]